MDHSTEEIEQVKAWLLGIGARPQDLDVEPVELPGVVLNVLLRSDATMTARDLAERSGTEPEHIAAMYQEIGITVDDLDEVRFTEGEADLDDLLTTSVIDRFTPQEGHELIVVMARALSSIADASVAEYVQTVEARLLEGGGSLLDWAEANAEVTGMARRLAALLGPLFLHYLDQSVQHQRQAQQDVSSRAVMRVAVGFVDLVGFTPLASTLSPGELSTMMGEFESLAFDLANQSGARVVKHIGDEIMFTAVEPEAACRMAVALRDEVATSERPRGGLSYGEVISRRGDYYGPVVNLASRLTDEAIPGEVLVSKTVRDQAEDLSFEPAGRRLLKGFAEPVEVFSLG